MLWKKSNFDTQNKNVNSGVVDIKLGDPWSF